MEMAHNLVRPDVRFFSDSPDFATRDYSNNDTYVTPIPPPTPVKSPPRTRLGQFNTMNNSLSLAVEKSMYYEIIGNIFQGKNSKVDKVRNVEDGKIYAMKRSGPFRGRQHRRHTLVEALIARFLVENPHPNILRYHECFEEDGYMYIISEYCENTLEMFIERHGRLDEDYIWKIFVDLLLGLNHLHSCGIVHRDLKPENILIRNNDDVVIGDFSIATETGMNVTIEGDSRYLSPEQQREEPNSRLDADIYSLGVMLYELAGNYRVPENIGHVWQLADNKIKYIPDRSKELNYMIMQMLQSDPLRRPTCATLMRTKRVSAMVSGRRDKFLSIVEYLREYPSVVSGMSTWLRQMVKSFLIESEDGISYTGANLMGTGRAESTSQDIQSMEEQILLSPPPITATPQVGINRHSFDLTSAISTYETPAMQHPKTVGRNLRRTLFDSDEDDDTSSLDDRLQLDNDSDGDTAFMDFD